MLSDDCRMSIRRYHVVSSFMTFYNSVVSTFLGEMIFLAETAGLCGHNCHNSDDARVFAIWLPDFINVVKSWHEQNAITQ